VRAGSHTAGRAVTKRAPGAGAIYWVTRAAATGLFGRACAASLPAMTPGDRGRGSPVHFWTRPGAATRSSSCTRSTSSTRRGHGRGWRGGGGGGGPGRGGGGGRWGVG